MKIKFFDFSNLKGDLFGGLTAGIVALPLALAFGEQSGLGAAAGLYGAAFIAFFAALFGGTNTQISGPTAPMTALSMVIIAGILQANEGKIEQALPAILMVFLLAGLFQILLGVVKVGTYIKYIPYTVVSGFMTGIGVIIIITQIIPAIGYYPSNDAEFVNKFKPQAEEVILERILREEAKDKILVLEEFSETHRRAAEVTEDEIMLEARLLAVNDTKGVIGSIKNIPRAISQLSLTELLLALLTILIIYGFKRITTAIPSTLVALVVVTVGSILLNVEYVAIQEIPAGFPEFQSSIITGFDLGSVTPYLFTAFILALLGAIDSLLTSVVADNMTKTKHEPNQELIGQGIGNSIASFFGGLPGAGATIRTVVNIQAGGKTKISGMIAGVLLLVIIVALGPLASTIPAAVLAGILITVGIGVMDYKGLKAFPKMQWTDRIVLIVVLVLTVFWQLVYAVGVGLVIAALIFMKKMGDMTTKGSGVRKINEPERAWIDEKQFPDNLKEEVFIKHLDGPLFFGNTSDVQALSLSIPDQASHVIIRMDKVPYIDQSGLFTLEDILMELNKKGTQVLFVGVKKPIQYRLESIDIIPDLVPEEQCFDTFDECTAWVTQNVKDTIP